MFATMPYAEVCAELDRRVRVTPGLERIEELLDRLGNPQKSYRRVQVVGTNGKGTTAVTVAFSLEEVGYSTGAYLSPHVLSYTERIVIGGEYVSEQSFAAALGRVIEVADESGILASQFELLTAGSLVMFRDAGVEWAVLEAGLGARYDATTAAGSEAVVLTNVGLDHTEYLGETIEGIAAEKVAGLSAGGTLILGTTDPEVLEIAERQRQKTGARLVVPEDLPADSMSVEDNLSYTDQNISLGLRAAEEVAGRPLDEKARRRVSRRARHKLPGRFEIHEIENVPVIVDGGHNLEGLNAALREVRRCYRDRPLGVVFGVLRDKDVGSMLTALEKEARHLVLTRPENHRAADPEVVAARYEPHERGGGRARVVADVGKALDGAVSRMKRMDGVVLVTGSLYTGAPTLRRLRAN